MVKHVPAFSELSSLLHTSINNKTVFVSEVVMIEKQSRMAVTTIYMCYYLILAFKNFATSVAKSTSL